MPTQQPLRHVDPHAPRGPLYRAFARLASSRFATWLSKKSIWSAIVWKIDPHLLRLTKGRLGTGLLLPTALLETSGARTGLPRCKPGSPHPPAGPAHRRGGSRAGLKIPM
jgi:hypothetical protein